MTLFVSGKLFNKAGAGEGGGSGDQHNLGYYATPEALRIAHPTAEAGDWAIVGSTDTIWVWDVEGESWVDTDTKGEVTPDMVIIKSLTMPIASTTPAGSVYQYIGATNATYTHGYVYENKKTATYTGTVSFEPATISGVIVTCSGDDFAAFLATYISNVADITTGTLTYIQAADLWRIEGKNSGGETVDSFQVYQEDYELAGFTFTGTPQDGDVVTFACSITEVSASYAWNRLDVQPAGATIDDSSVSSLTATWSANKLNTVLGNVETLLSQI